MENLFSTLLRNYVNEIEGITAVAICDRNGLIIASVGRDKERIESESVIGVISVVLDSYIDRIKQEFGTESDFFNITSTGDKKFVYCSKGPNSIVTTITNLSTSDIELRVYSEHVASKVEMLIAGNENVSLEIPEIVRTLSKTGGKLPLGEFSSKLIMTGDFQSGKTSLTRRFVENTFKESYISTIGVEIKKKTMVIVPGTSIQFIIWDIGGQRQEMMPYRKRFYTGANACFIVIDRTRPRTLENFESWYKEIKEVVKQDIPMIIIGNKSDLVNEIQVSEMDIKNLAEKYNFHYILTSAKTGENVNDSFLYIAHKFLENV